MARPTRTNSLAANRLAVTAKNAASKQRTETETPRSGAEETKSIETARRGRPRKETTITEPGNKKGLQPGQERFSVVIDTALLEELRDYAYTERITLKEAVTDAVRYYLDAKYAEGITIISRHNKKS